MAVDTNSLAYLIDPFWQGEGINGKPLVAGYMCVYIAGTDQKYITWQNWDGTRHPFKIPLGSDGRATILVEVQYTYDCYLYDSFGNLVCSRLNVKPAIGGDVTVYGLTEVWHDGTMSGEGTPQSPLSVVSAGKVYTGIEPIVVNNIENKISAQHIPLGVQDPLYFVEDSETACIIGFSGETIPEGVMSESALGFENNKITGYNGSAFSAGNEYEAGSYVDIDNNTINVTGLQPEGDYAYNSALSSKLDVTALPQDLVHSGDLTAYYPIDNPSGFITGVDLTDYATTAQLDEKLDKSDSGNFYPMTGNPSGFLTAHQSLQGYATEQWVEGKGYITGVDIPESATWNATTQTVSANSAQWAGGTANPQIPVTGINGIKISESADQVVFEVSANYATEDWVTGQGYLTAETDWTNTITAASANAYNEATAAIPAPFDPTYLSGQIDNKLDSAIYAADSGNFLTALPSDLVYTADIQDMATTAQVAEKLDTTAFSTVSGDFLTAHQSLADYQTTAGMTAYQPAGNYQTAGDYLTTADSAEFMTTAERSDYIPTGVSSEFYTTANTANYISEVPDTYLQNTDLSTTDGKVTAISGIPLSAGGDVPEGVMVESALEYNAVNEISGYNGSAIAQYGAEKQWLQHDDTLVHAANSAQYALGVNLSAVAQLLGGIDETVLWSGSANAGLFPITLSEPATAFEEIKFVWTPRYQGDYGCPTVVEVQNTNPHNGTLKYTLMHAYWNANTPWLGAWYLTPTDNYTKIASDKNAFCNMMGSQTAMSEGLNCFMWKVIGIGRKA